MTTRRRRLIVILLFVVVGLPVLLVLLVAASLHVLNETNGTIVSSGVKREYLLYVPTSYDRAKPTPLVISLHAAALWPAAQMKTSQWNKVADEHGFIVVYPSATAMAPLPFLPRLPVWRTDETEPEAGLTEDVRFVSDLIDALQSDYNIDATRVYANGFSNGGAMASVLTCALSDRIAAVGTVSPAQDTPPESWFAGCQPVPMIQFHGTADGFVPYSGGLSWPTPRPFPSVLTWAANWARRNRCGPEPVESVVATDVSRLEYTNCAENATVVLYTVRGGGHSWPGGQPLPEWWAGPTSRRIDASSEMWTFFREHCLSRH
jgi:polyhydroxybutyrate depolymerase